MYAIFKDGSRQYKASEGDVIELAYRDAEVGRTHPLAIALAAMKQCDLALVVLDARADRYPTPEAFEHAVRGAASAVTHLHRGGFSPELWSSERSPGSRSDNRYQHAMEMLASIQPTPNLDLRRTVARLRRQGVGGGALILVTGIPDEGVLGAYRVLAKDFTRTVVMVVADRPGEPMGTFPSAGAVTVYAGPSGAWAPAWRTAMELSWSTASAG